MTTLKILTASLLLAASGSALSSCHPPEVAPATPGTTLPVVTPPTNPGTPATTIPDELVGTWFARDNKRPLTTYWNQGTVLGEEGSRDFRTMVFTKDGTNAVEYSTVTFTLPNEVRTRFYKFTGTLEYRPGASPATLTFHATSGVMRLYSDKAPGYQESPIVAADVEAHRTVWQNPVATSYPTATNYLSCKILNGGIPVTAQYQKVNPNAPPDPDMPTTTPPATGTFVKVGSLYYRTATIGTQEWTTMNYAGPGGIPDPEHPYYGSFLKQADLGSVPVPAGWRLPTRQDVEKLLATQGVVLEPWDMTADDAATTRALGPLLAATNWKRADPWNTNATGFSALPANVQISDQYAVPPGEGSNFIIWTSAQDAGGRNYTFKIIQMTSTTYASLRSFAPGTNVNTEVHAPLRLVRDR